VVIDWRPVSLEDRSRLAPLRPRLQDSAPPPQLHLLRHNRSAGFQPALRVNGNGVTSMLSVSKSAAPEKKCGLEARAPKRPCRCRNSADRPRPSDAV